jgi:hypothetical protein
MSLFDELKRRNVIRMPGLYLLGAWLIVQVAITDSFLRTMGLADDQLKMSAADDTPNT